MSFRSLIGKSFASSVHKRIILFALIAAPLFTLFAIAQTLFVRHETQAIIKQEQTTWAKEIKDQIAYRDAWNLEGYRRANISVPEWDVVTSNGLLVDVEGFLPNFFPPARLFDDAIVRGPQTIATETGEKWRILQKKLDGGALVVGYQITGDGDDDVGTIDNRLEKNAGRFGSSFIQAAKTEARNIDFEIDYAILKDSGELVADWGGVPLKVDPVFLQEFSSTEKRVVLGTKTYLVFSTPILNSQGKSVGTILVPRDITFAEMALRNQVMFNFWTSIILWAFVVLLSVLFVHWVVRRQQRLSSLKSALAAQKLEESHSIEFKRVFKWDFQHNQPNNELRLNFFLKPVAAFLNSDGGTLFIGVEDNGTVRGISEDLACFNGSPDQFERELMQLIAAKIDPSYSRYVYVEFARIHGLSGPTVCVVDVLPALRPAFVKWNREVYFYKRAGRMSEPLDPEEQHNYIRDKWG